MFYSSLKFVNSARSNWIWHIGINCDLVLDYDILADEGSKFIQLIESRLPKIVSSEIFILFFILCHQHDFFFVWLSFVNGSIVRTNEAEEVFSIFFVSKFISFDIFFQMSCFWNHTHQYLRHFDPGKRFNSQVILRLG